MQKIIGATEDDIGAQLKASGFDNDHQTALEQLRIQLLDTQSVDEAELDDDTPVYPQSPHSDGSCSDHLTDDSAAERDDSARESGNESDALCIAQPSHRNDASASEEGQGLHSLWLCQLM